MALLQLSLSELLSVALFCGRNLKRNASEPLTIKRVVRDRALERFRLEEMYMVMRGWARWDPAVQITGLLRALVRKISISKLRLVCRARVFGGTMEPRNIIGSFQKVACHLLTPW